MMRRATRKTAFASTGWRACVCALWLVITLACTSAAASPFPHGPTDPAALGADARPTVVLMTATWCQWCKVLESRALPDARVADVVERRYRAFTVDVDRAPRWMDLPDVQGLPTLAFFDRAGRHVLSKSGYRDPDALALMLDAAADKIDAGDLEPYPPREGAASLSAAALSPPRAQAMLARIEERLFFLVNSNEGGFLSPARHPFPALLVELERWRRRGAPDEVGTWVDLTVANALRGESPRLRGDPHPSLTFTGVELRSLARARPPYPDRWYAGIEELASSDPWLGVQDPVDGGVFRYASAAGWFHPHFERSARDNIAWVELLRVRGERARAARIERFVRRTFFLAGGVAASQTSDPFYYRLRAGERRGVPAPRVDALFSLDAAAAATAIEPARCRVLAKLDGARWPKLLLAGDGSTSGAEAPADVVGVVLSALSRCGHDAVARRLADTATARWRAGELDATPRLWVLAGGICDATPTRCALVLGQLDTLEVDPAYPPPIEHLTRWARR